MKAQFYVTRRFIEVLPSVRVRTGFSTLPTSITFSWIIFAIRITL
jgi:hypothetical protein